MQDIETFRHDYRRQEIGPRYRGWLHFGFTTGVCTLIIAGCLLQLDAVSWAEALSVPVTFLFANLVEHFGHRRVMHRPVRGLTLLFKRHAGQHHVFFQPGHMAYGSSRDFKAVLFPPVLILFYFGVFALPVGLILTTVATPNVAFLFVATSVGYFLNYELFHFAYHMPDDSWVFRIPGLRRLSHLHHSHHDPALMSHYNFNITYPIGDWIFRTYAGPRHRPDITARDHTARPAG